MERFTKKVDGVWTASCEYGRPPYPVVTQEVIDRLAAYEDTGFTPAEVQQMRWIPVEERKPKLSDNPILVYKAQDAQANFIGTAWYSSLHGWTPTNGTKINSLTHWMPLPPPPTGER